MLKINKKISVDEFYTGMTYKEVAPLRDIEEIQHLYIVDENSNLGLAAYEIIDYGKHVAKYITFHMYSRNYIDNKDIIKKNLLKEYLDIYANKEHADILINYGEVDDVVIDALLEYEYKEVPTTNFHMCTFVKF